MSKLEYKITIDTLSGTNTLQVGDGNVATINLGKSGDTINIPTGATITNSGTANNFGGTNTPSFLAYKTSAQSIADTEQQFKLLLIQNFMIQMVNLLAIDLLRQ